MALNLRLNLFHQVEAAHVWGALRELYAARRASVVETTARGNDYELYALDSSWCVLDWDAGWEWKQRREAQLFVSKRLQCKGLLVFVFGGAYWGYELFQNGEVLDRFVQYPSGDGQHAWFPDDPAVGDADVFARCFPEISADQVRPYLVRRPLYGEDEASRQRLNVPARAGDEFRRFDACAILDFLRLLGVRVQMQDGYVTLLAPSWKRFAIQRGG
jgi:hypothetical protein